MHFIKQLELCHTGVAGRTRFFLPMVNKNNMRWLLRLNNKRFLPLSSVSRQPEIEGSLLSVPNSSCKMVHREDK